MLYAIMLQLRLCPHISLAGEGSSYSLRYDVVQWIYMMLCIVLGLQQTTSPLNVTAIHQKCRLGYGVLVYYENELRRNCAQFSVAWIISTTVFWLRQRVCLLSLSAALWSTDINDGRYRSTERNTRWAKRETLSALIRFDY